MNAARCFSGTRATVRFSEATVVTSGSRVQRFNQGDVKVEQDIVTFNEEDHMKTLSWRKDLKLNAARCFSGTHATVRFAKKQS